jgi:hypothetical protein
MFFPEPRVSRAEVAVDHMCQWFPRFADRMGLAPVPKKYHVVRTTEFNKDLERILDLLAKPALLPVRQELFKLLGRLLELRSKPKAKRHWTYRLLVIQDQHGVVAKEIPTGTRVRETDLGRREHIVYVIKETIYAEQGQQLFIWGHAICSYRVSYKDVHVYLKSINLYPSHDVRDWQ